MRTSGYRFIPLAAGLLSLAQAGPVLAGPWDMDTTYGEGGVVTYNPDGTTAVRANPDGTLLEVTRTSTGAVLGHRDVNGRRDSFFGAAGTLQVDFPPGFGTYDVFPVVDSSGRLLWCGHMDVNNDKVQDMAILRLTPTGTPDAAFGTGGIVSRVAAAFPASGVGNYGDRCESLASQPDGRVVAAVARYAVFYDDAISMWLLRFNPDGSPDTSFGGGTGSVPVIPSSYEGGSNVRVLPNGWITVFAGDHDHTFDAGGSSVFGPQAAAGLPFPSYTYDDPVDWQIVGIPGSGDMLLVGDVTGQGLVVAREHSDASLDRSFGPAGTGFIQLRPATAGSYRSVSAVISPDGQRLYIVVYDYNSNGEPAGGEIIRLIATGAAAGQFDPDFGSSGRVAWPFPGFALAEQFPGSVVLNGSQLALRLSAASGPSPGIVGFTNGGGATGPENSAFAVRVVRVAGHDGVASIAYATAENQTSGKAGVNYEAASGTLRWADGDAVDKQITLNLLKGASNILPGFLLRLNSPQGAVLFANEMNIGVKGSSPAFATFPPPPPAATNTTQVVSGGGSTDPVSLLLFLLGGGAALRSRNRSLRE